MSFKGAIGYTPKCCEGCVYRQVGTGSSNCGYALMTGELRNCPPEECTHYDPQPRGAELRAERLERRLESV